MRIYEKAYAKLNLYLDVLGRRADGFHSLRSVMQTVGLADTLTVDVMAAGEPSVTLTVRGRYRVPVGEGNLAHRAAMLYMQKAALPLRVHVTIDKRIPVAAGLGGGSADAAAVLRALNRASGGRLGEGRLAELGAALGSDVPFCLFGHTRLCEGRGEVMRPLPALPPLSVVIAPSSERISTREAFAALDLAHSGFSETREHGDLEGLVDALSRRNTADLTTKLYNIFEEPVLALCPIAAEKRRRLASLGALATLMSGSGPTVFGLFSDETAALAAAKALGDGAVTTTAV
ncbi:MAG: 4-(cytidine 5'-diphospho)-2-C-methyl-D-erythritol kinase [Clostridia bacterium]|nr:4-(cytidine 5'-diphospho)-2-C-methyl-D-erythritol kinase [Clostridia bacterium]